MNAEREMPQYQCHKKVWALKIERIMPQKYQSLETSEKFLLIPSDKGFGPVEVSKEYFDKHKPQAGGYYVVYPGGYKSFSPAEAFESGYTKI